MRSFFFLFIVLILVSCVSQKPVLNADSVVGTEIKKQGSKMYGKIVIKSVSKGTKEMPTFYFDRNGVEFFINIPEGKVAKEEIQKYVYKDIDIIGEIKTGALSTSKNQTRSEQENNSKQDGAYIVIYKIIEP